MSRPISYAGLKLEAMLADRGLRLAANVIDDVATEEGIPD